MAILVRLFFLLQILIRTCPFMFTSPAAERYYFIGHCHIGVITNITRRRLASHDHPQIEQCWSH